MCVLICSHGWLVLAIKTDILFPPPHSTVFGRTLKVIGVNAAGLLSEMHSFEQLLKEENPSVFCLQEMKLKKVHQIKTDSSKNYTIYL